MNTNMTTVTTQTHITLLEISIGAHVDEGRSVQTDIVRHGGTESIVKYVTGGYKQQEQQINAQTRRQNNRGIATGMHTQKATSTDSQIERQQSELKDMQREDQTSEGEQNQARVMTNKQTQCHTDRHTDNQRHKLISRDRDRHQEMVERSEDKHIGEVLDGGLANERQKMQRSRVVISGMEKGESRSQSGLDICRVRQMEYKRGEGQREEASELEEGESSWKYVGSSRNRGKEGREVSVGMDQTREIQGSAKRNSVLKGHVEGTETRKKIRPMNRGEVRRQGSDGGIYEDVGKTTQESREEEDQRGAVGGQEVSEREKKEQKSRGGGQTQHLRRIRWWDVH
jgi:hypothetical protein